MKKIIQIFKNHFLILLLFIVAFAFNSCKNGNVWEERVLLAYRNQKLPTVHFKYWNGSTWTAEGLTNIHDTPNGEATNLYNGGVGLASSQEQALTLMGSWIGNKIHFRMGLGGGLFKVYPPDYVIPEGAGSAPYIAHIDGDNWLVAYKSSITSRVVIYTYDINRSGIDLNLNLAGDLYTRSKLDDVVGRPAMVYNNGKVILFWLGTNPRELHFLTASYQLGNTYLILEETGIFPIPDNEKYGGNSEPALAFNGSKYFLGYVTRPFTEAGDLHYETLYVYSSADGINWTKFTPPPLLDMPTWGSNISLAALKNDELFVAVKNSGGQSKGFHHKNGTWEEFTESQLFSADRDSYTTESLSLIRFMALVKKE